jgi:hypothetical protein
MNTLIHADVFFFISSIGFIILFALFVIALVYLIKLIRSLHRAIEMLKAKANSLEEDAEELLEDVRESVIFRLIFGRKRHTRARTNKK